MAFSVKEIRSTLKAGGGPARPTMYSVHIIPPAAVGLSPGLARDLSFLCEKAVLPGRQFKTTPHMIYGVERKMPYGPQYVNLSLTFICDNDMRPRWFFDLWQAKIQQPNSGFFYYYNDYVGTLRIFKLDEHNQATYEIMIEEAYPITIMDQQLSYSSNNQYLSLTVQFAYRRWKNFQDEIRVGPPTVDPHSPLATGSYTPYNGGLDRGSDKNEDLPVDNAPAPRSPHGDDVYSTGSLQSSIGDGLLQEAEGKEGEGHEHGGHSEGAAARTSPSGTPIG